MSQMVETCEQACGGRLVEASVHRSSVSPKLGRNWVLVACWPVPFLSQRAVAPAALHSRLRLNSVSLWKNTFAPRPTGRLCIFRAFLF